MVETEIRLLLGIPVSCILHQFLSIDDEWVGGGVFSGPAGVYVNAACAFLRGVEAKPAQDGKEASEAKLAVQQWAPRRGRL